LTTEKDKISIWNEGQFSLLYDYTVKVGQSWDFTYTATQNGEKKTETIRMVLDSMRWANPTSPLISQHQIRYISLQRAVNGIYQTYHHDRLIDDIGFNSHLLPKSNLFPCSDSKGAIENLLCFESLSLLDHEPYTKRFTKKDCKNTDAVTENNPNYDLHVFPNPAQEEITIASEGIGFEKGDFKIFDLQGQTVYAQPLTQNDMQQQFNIAGLKNGFYVYEIRFGKYSAKKGKLLIVR
jgi:Secretion system C-terminal sorting domain